MLSTLPARNKVSSPQTLPLCNSHKQLDKTEMKKEKSPDQEHLLESKEQQHCEEDQRFLESHHQSKILHCQH